MRTITKNIISRHSERSPKGEVKNPAGKGILRRFAPQNDKGQNVMEYAIILCVVLTSILALHFIEGLKTTFSTHLDTASNAMVNTH